MVMAATIKDWDLFLNHRGHREHRVFWGYTNETKAFNAEGRWPPIWADRRGPQ